MTLYLCGKTKNCPGSNHALLAAWLLSIACIIAPITARSESLFDYKSSAHGNLAIDYSSVDPSHASYQIAVKQDLAGQASIFSLESPPRFVVDLPGNYPAIVKNSEIHLKSIYQNSPLKGVRIGTHPEKLRIVFDLNESEHLNFSLSGEGITINLAPQSSADLEPSDEIPVNHVEPPTPQEVPSKLTILSAKRESFSMEPTPDLLAPTLTAFAYERIQPGNIPMIRLSLNSPPNFSLNKRDENSYDLTISSVTLTDKRLALPYFPPSNFDGFTFFQASDAENGIKAKIGIDPNRYLTAFVRGNELFIRSLER